MRRTSTKDLDVRVHLLEAVGATYRCIWSSSDDLFSFSAARLLEAEDIDRDGVCELMFSDRMYGTHQNSHFLYIYFPRRKQVFSISEHSNPSWFPGPPTPSLVLDPEPPDEVREAIIEAATARGLLRLVDGTSLWFAIHVEVGLGRFHEASKTLQRIEKVGDRVLPEVHELTFDEAERRLIVNGSIEIDPADVPLGPGPGR